MTRAGRWARRRWAATSEWSRRHPTVMACIFMALLVSVPLARAQQVADHQRASDRQAAARQHAADQRQLRIARQQADDNAARIAEEQAIIHALHADLACIEDWINRSFERSLAITDPANARINDLFAAVEAALIRHDQAAAVRLTLRALREHNAYLKATRQNPLPVPELRCRRLLPDTPAPSSATPSRSPAAPQPSRTPTETVTAIAPGPTVTRTVTQTRTVTATATRTVTATVTVPPGHQK